MTEQGPAVSSIPQPSESGNALGPALRAAAKAAYDEFKAQVKAAEERGRQKASSALGAWCERYGLPQPAPGQLVIDLGDGFSFDLAQYHIYGPCPSCGEQVRGDFGHGSLADIGNALTEFRPYKGHDQLRWPHHFALCVQREPTMLERAREHLMSVHGLLRQDSGGVHDALDVGLALQQGILAALIALAERE